MKLVRFSRFYRWAAAGITLTTLAAFFSERVRENLLTTWDHLQQIDAQTSLDKGCRVVSGQGAEVGAAGSMKIMTMRCPDGSTPSYVVRIETMQRLSRSNHPQ